MNGSAQVEPVLSEARARGLRKMLLVVVGLGGLLVVLSLATAFAGVERFAVVVGIVAVLLLLSGGATLRALPERGVAARRGCVVTAILLIVLAVPLVAVFIGLIMAIAGVGLLFMVYTPEREEA